MKLKREQLEEEKRQFDLQYELSKSKSSSSSGGGGGGTTKTYGSGNINKDGSLKGGSGEEQPSVQKNPTSNMASLKAIGLGNATAADLARLISQGLVKRTVVNGQYYYTRTGGSSGSGGNRLKNMEISLN